MARAAFNSPVVSRTTRQSHTPPRRLSPGQKEPAPLPKNLEVTPSHPSAYAVRAGSK